MSALPRLSKDAPPVGVSAPSAAVDIVEATVPALVDGRHGSVSSTLTDDDKKSAGTGTWSPASYDRAESLVSDAPLSQSHIFQDEKVAQRWRQLYETTKYENRHRFDPNFEWTAEEEKKVLRKVDFRILVWSWIMFMSLDLIRKNINRALADNFLSDLGMNQNDFNNGQVVFLAAFLCAELPSGLISKKLGADIWVPTQIVSWSIISASQAALSNKAGFFITRALQGLSQGGFLPDQILYLSYWYTGKELNTRLSWFYTVLGISQIVGSLLAAGFLELRGVNGLAGWRYLFGFEGLITGLIGILSFFLLARGPTQTAGLLRGKSGWFNEREEKILVNRVLRDDPTKGDMNNREGLSLRALWKALSGKDLWPVYLLGLVVFIPYSPPQTYLSLILRQLGYGTLRSNLLCIPSQFFFALNTIPYTWLSARLNERSILASLSNVWNLAFLIPLYLLKESSSNHYDWIRYALITALTSVPYCHPFLIGWVSQNSQSVRNRAVALCLYNMSVQVGSILSTRIYTNGDRPYYRKGNLALISLAVLSIVLCWLVKFYYIQRNKQKRRVWDSLSAEQQLEYKHNTKDEGAKRLDVLLVH
ncbi:related to permease [Melanopsichium pennsylvanicum]|uniref:Related to permease n=2 Tax=Melanopsichium pennsylvanicum TaxID=63383 RepID=A0AAJ5C467_9BASI|nr:permease of the major facilitator superfamily [Melanopsichium pennsylvanicum 4]SNX83371.1 related to permease [Melanopsichium pennsylvanicum]